MATTDHVSILTRLRAETRSDHDAIESALGLDADGLTISRYRRTLERFYGFHGPLETAIAAAGDWSERGLNLNDRRKAPWLEADLVALGVSDPQALPRCPNLPPHSNPASGFGCLYVIEGSMLGGQVLSRRLRDTLGITPETGGRFFRGYGERTGAMWQAFRSALDDYAAAQGPEQEQDIIEAAVATFRTLRLWCEEGLD